eukprot:scaffold28294_cov55-Phaeocystis_antarctica.AAC.2
MLCAHGASRLATGTSSGGPAARCSQQGGVSTNGRPAGWQLCRGEAAATLAVRAVERVRWFQMERQVW